MLQVVTRPQPGVLHDPKAECHIAGVSIPSSESPVAIQREGRRRPTLARLLGGLIPQLLGIGHINFAVFPENVPELSETAGKSAQ